MKKLLLGIILGSLFFAYGESYRPHPMAYVGNKIKDISLITTDNVSVRNSKKDNIFLERYVGPANLSKICLYSRPLKIFMYNSNLNFYCETFEFEMANDEIIEFITFNITIDKENLNKCLAEFSKGYQALLFNLETFENIKASSSFENEKETWRMYRSLTEVCRFPTKQEKRDWYTYDKRKTDYEKEYHLSLQDDKYELPCEYEKEITNLKFKKNINYLQGQYNFIKVYEKEDIILTIRCVEKEDGKLTIIYKEFQKKILQEFEYYNIYNIYTKFFYYNIPLEDNYRLLCSNPNYLEEKEMLRAFLAYKSGNIQNNHLYKIVE